MKKQIILGMIFTLLLTMIPTNSFAKAKPGVSAQSAVLMEQQSGRVLYAKNPNQKRNIASITKIMTAIIAIESGKLDDIVTVSKKAVYTEGSSIYLEEGDKVKLKDLVYGLMLRSGNDAAVAIAEYVGGSEQGFVHLMNEKANWIGMTNSHFANPHGLDAKGHYSTAYDMALLTRYAMQNDTFRKITGTVTYKAETEPYAWRNKNKLLTRYYKYCTGGKTGYTKSAGRTLVSTARKNDMNLIMVTLNASSDWNDHQNVYEWAYDNYDMTKVQEKGEYSFQSLDHNTNTNGYYLKDILVPLNESEIDKVKQTNYLLNTPSENDGLSIIGKSVYSIDGKVIAEASIVSKYQEDKEDEGFLESVMNLFKKLTGVF